MIGCGFCAWATPLWVRRGTRRLNGWARLAAHIERAHPDVDLKHPTRVITGTTTAGLRALDRVRDQEEERRARP